MQQAIEQLVKGRTVLVIAHRLSTVQARPVALRPLGHACIQASWYMYAFGVWHHHVSLATLSVPKDMSHPTNPTQSGQTWSARGPWTGRWVKKAMLETFEWPIKYAAVPHVPIAFTVLVGFQCQVNHARVTCINAAC